LSVSAPSATGASATLDVLDDEDVNSPPAGYYDAANGISGNALKSALKIIASPANYRSYTYSNTYTPLRSIYEDPANTSNVVTVYSGTSVGKNTNYYPGGPSADVSWSREHVWPDSFGLDPTNVNPGDTNGDAGQDYTDLFNLRPCLQTLNSQRSNRYYDATTGAGTIPPLAPECSYNTNSWEPRDNEKGDLARTIFYMAMRYDGSDALTYDLEVANTANAGIGRFANLSTLVRWNEQDPVSTEERQRNQNIYANWQRNRNPFIDHPEFIALIWGTVRQSSQVAAVTEGGTTGSYTMQLASAPTANVTINLAVSPGGQVNFSPSSLVFTSMNWDQPQTVDLSAVDDAVHEATLVAQVSHSIASGDSRYAVLVPANVAVTVNDNDPVIAPTTLPVNYGGPWSPLPSGFLAQNLGTPYTGSLGGDSGTGSAKFDATGSRLTIGFNTPPAMLTYQLKGNPASGTATSGTFRVEQSADGVNFTTVRTVSNKNNTDQAFSDPLLLTARYVSFVLVEKISGNLQLDKIGISSAPAFQAWLAGFGLSGLDADPGTDFDFDGAVNLVEYGLGGSPVKADAASRQPVATRVGSKFRLTAIVRVNDPALSATAQTTVNPGNANSWTSSGVVRLTGVDQSGVAAGFERTIFEVDASIHASRFLRLVFTLN